MEEDEFTEDFERLTQMRKQQKERLREARQMVEELEKAVAKINGQLEFIQYRRNKTAEDENEKKKEKKE